MKVYVSSKKTTCWENCVPQLRVTGSYDLRRIAEEHLKQLLGVRCLSLSLCCCLAKPAFVGGELCFTSSCCAGNESVFRGYEYSEHFCLTEKCVQKRSENLGMCSIFEFKKWKFPRVESAHSEKSHFCLCGIGSLPMGCDPGV